MSGANRSYLAQSAAAAAFYVVVTLASRLIAREFTLEGLSLKIVAAVPILPAILWTMLYVRRLQDMDELQKRIHVEAFAAAGLFVGLVTFSLGMIEDVAAPRISIIFVFPALIFVWGALACILRWRYSR